MMDILIKAGADFDAVDEEGKTVLIEAAKNGILKNDKLHSYRSITSLLIKNESFR